MLIIIGHTYVYGQDVISGTITDATTDDPLIGATVKIQGTSIGTVADLDGNYTINANSDDILEISFIGYITKTISVNSQTTIDVILQEDSKLLNEVVVIGYGEQRKKVATASISKVTSEDLARFGVPNVANSLQGQVSGVIFKSQSGQPGAIPQIFIRGIGTNGDNNPLVIVDDLTYDDPSILTGINPNDVESINILKDGASTAIYGTRAANGIIIVTTKKAKRGKGTFSYSGSVGFQSAWRVPETLNREQYTELLTEKYANSNLTPPDQIVNGASSPYNSNWLDEIFETTAINSHQISVAKGSEKSRFRASFSLVDQEGLIAPEKSNYQRMTGRITADQEINKYLFLGQNIFYTQTKGSRIPENNEFGTPIADALVYDPLTPIKDENSQFGFGQSALVQKEYVNPLSRIFITNDKYINRELAGNAYLGVRPIKNLTLKSDIAIRVANNATSGFIPVYQLTPAFENVLNDVFAYREEFTRWKWENTINYQNTFNKHKIDVLLGVAAQEDDFLNLGGSSSGIQPEVEFNPNFQYIDGGVDSLDMANGTEGIRYAISSQFARIIYQYDNKYLFTFILRRDGSSRFGPSNRYAIFPSASVGWVISSENFWNPTVVNFLKIRSSYGENGNDRIGDNLFRSTVNNVYSYQFGKPTSQFVYIGSTTPILANPEVRWERSKHFDIGFELGLFDDKISIEYDYYSKITEDLLFTDPAAPLLIGTAAPISNLGEFKNTGMELEINYTDNFGGLKLNVGLNLTYLENEVTKLNGENPFVNLYSWPVRNIGITRFQEGEPVGFFRGYKTLGIFRSEREIFSHINSDGLQLQPNAVPGDLKFEDVNRDGKIDTEDITKIGKPWADFTFGLKLGVSFKNFDLSTLWFASIGSEIYRTYERQDVPNNNYQVEWLDRYSESNPNGSYPRVSISDPNANSRPSDFYVESGDFLRLRNVQLAYNIPLKIIEKIKMTKARIYISADNLLTLTGYTGFDPEVGGGIGNTGLDRGFYPATTTIISGINISF